MPGAKGSGGKRAGAGRPRIYTTFERHERLVVERAPIGGVGTAEAGVVLSVSASEMEIQIGDDILVIRRPDFDE